MNSLGNHYLFEQCVKCSVHIHVRSSIITNLCHVFCKGNPNLLFSWPLGSSCDQLYWLYCCFTIWKWICIYHVQKLFKPWWTFVNVALHGPLARGHHEGTCLTSPDESFSERSVTLCSWQLPGQHARAWTPLQQCAQDLWTGDWQVLNKIWWFQLINSQPFVFKYKFQVKTSKKVKVVFFWMLFFCFFVFVFIFFFNWTKHWPCSSFLTKEGKENQFQVKDCSSFSSSYSIS